MLAAGETPALLRLCLDLNVWVADFLAPGEEGGAVARHGWPTRLGPAPAKPVRCNW